MSLKRVKNVMSMVVASQAFLEYGGKQEKRDGSPREVLNVRVDMACQVVGILGQWRSHHK